MSTSPGANSGEVSEGEISRSNRLYLRFASAAAGFGLSPFRRLLRTVAVVTVVVVVPLFILVGESCGYATAYGIVLGLTNAFGEEVRAGWPRGVAAALGVMGWIAVPTVIGIVASEMFTRRMGRLADLTPSEIDALMEIAVPPSASGGTPGQHSEEDQ